MRDFKVSFTMWEFKVVWHIFLEALQEGNDSWLCAIEHFYEWFGEPKSLKMTKIFMETATWDSSALQSTAKG